MALLRKSETPQPSLASGEVLLRDYSTEFGA